MAKINSKRNFRVRAEGVAAFMLMIFLIYSRLVGLGWGLPYPMHPDERNMAVAVQSLNCELTSWRVDGLNGLRIEELRNCLNPHFFAYGQFPLYLAYFGLRLWHWCANAAGPVSFAAATIALRLIAALASIATALILVKIAVWLKPKTKPVLFLLIFTSIPYAIQLAHFGTTESLLMCLYTVQVYLGLVFLKKRLNRRRFIALSALTIGLAVATKISAVTFTALPVVLLWLTDHRVGQARRAVQLAALLILVAAWTLIFSPHYLLNFPDFISASHYETAVALGQVVPFYTRQFVNSIPVWFQFVKVFPYALGWPLWLAALLGIIMAPWRRRSYRLLGLVLVVAGFPNAFIFAKWTRFMALTFPVLALFGGLALADLLNIGRRHLSPLVYYGVGGVLIMVLILPGLAELSLYQREDIRLTASRWISETIPDGRHILSETANVVDLPLGDSYSRYRVINFNFYDLDSDPRLFNQLLQALDRADYIIVPSRRIWANYTCASPDGASVSASLVSGYRSDRCANLKLRYPRLNWYYQNLFNGQLGFHLVKEFDAYPGVSWFGQFVIHIDDEQAEETATVFDHPVIRIYQRRPSPP
ncbi:hypothetical protein M1523_03755 [Patescibacteria group bacterium]|nr:hypothetical protein [Patescibacteria group bacterium]MCL5091809.1 hypothetical protein [Patescibacteria group bacterium]